MNESLEGLRVLIVEDEALLAEELCLRLSRLGLVPLATVDTGDKAVQASLSLKPDLILMDIRLKGTMDGIEATEIISTITSVPTVFLTAHSDPETLKRAKGTQPYGYVLKPYNERDLIITLEMAVLRHKLHRRLQASEKRFSATLASIGDGVIAIESERRVSYINKVAAQLTGWSMKEALGRPIEEIFDLLDESTGELQQTNLLGQALEASHPVRPEGPSMLLHRDGTKIPVEASAAPIRSEDNGDNLGAVLVFQDLRAKRLEQQKLARVMEQLQLAQRMEAIAQLSGGLAHDFNNLLTIICCHAELLLEEEELTSGSREMVSEIRRAGRQGASITRRLLSFSRQQEVQRIPLPLPSLLQEMGKVLRRLLGDRITLAVSWEDGVRPISADPRQVEQILLNLAINARDAMPTGGTITLRAENHNTDDSSPLVKLVVTDTGSGIPPERLEKVFEPLYTTKEAGTGSGLGLTTVRSIVEQDGGRIEVTSRLGEGTSFLLFFPVADLETPPPPNQTAKPPMSGGPPSIKKACSILVVDDQPMVRASVSAVLQRRGYEVLLAKGAKEAEEIVNEQPEAVQLVLTDVEMPLISGQELARRIRAIHPQIPIVFLSAHSRKSLLEKHSLESSDNFLQKPFENCELIQKVEGLLRGVVD